MAGAFTKENAKEMARRSAESRRRKKEQSERSAEDILTPRQRMGVALSAELTIEDYRQIARLKKEQGDTLGLSRMADQAFGKPQEAELDSPRIRCSLP
jgi:hypothetical protein